MAATIDIVDVLASDVPLFYIKDFVAEDLICVSESVKDESNGVVSLIV